jgi:hypothetical protein
MNHANPLPAAYGNVSISQGVRDIEVLIPRFMRFVERYEPQLAYAMNKKYKGELCDDWYADLIHALDEMAPKGFYFDPKPGDSDNYGFWPIMTADEMALSQFVVKEQEEG